MSTSRIYHRVFDQGLVTGRNNIMSIPTRRLNHLCPAYGTCFCTICSFAQYIPDTCPMLDEEWAKNELPKLEGRSGKNKIGVYCCVCQEKCPCNRSLHYIELAKAIDRYRQRYVNET